ncbi:MAG: peptidylprolyl isomerase [Verrucomicrobiota bacterium]
MIFPLRAICLSASLLFLFGACSKVERPINRSNFQDRLPEVKVTVEVLTTLGPIQVELYRNYAPITVENFLQYMRDDHYDGTIFHRVIDGFIVQGGGFDENLQERPTRESILNEASNGLRNERGTIAMARTNDKDSASSQFYFNLADNEILDHGVRNYGYTVFGRIISGIEVIDAIAKVPVSDRDNMQSVPVDPVTVLNVREISREEIERGPVKRDKRF